MFGRSQIWISLSTKQPMRQVDVFNGKASANTPIQLEPVGRNETPKRHEG